MVNAYLIIVVVILVLAIIAANIYVIVYFQHPEDKNVAWFPKIIVLVGLTLAAWSILMLPLDVANSNTSGGGGFPMDQLWLAVYIIIAVMVVVIIPFAIFFYEGEDIEEGENAQSQFASAIKGTVATLFAFMVLVVILWFTIGIAEVPVVRFTSPLLTVTPPTQPEYYQFNDTSGISYLDPDWYLYVGIVNSTNCTDIVDTTFYNTTEVIEVDTTDDEGNPVTEFVTVNVTANYTNITTICYFPYKADPTNTTITRNGGEHLKYRVTFLLYIISMVVFLGWILFIVFGGIGLVALPFDCVNNFKNRPIRISLEQYTTRRREIGERATKLIEIGKALKEKQKRGTGSSRRARRKARTNYNKFRQAVFCLEEDYERLQTCYKRQGGKVILYFAMLLFGIIGAVTTVLWVLQILLFMFTQPYPFHPFLNDFLKRLDDAWGLLGVAFYGWFAFYLLLCVIKGNFKFGFRFFFLFPIHPMRVNGTLMNAFLFNTLLILVCAVSITQFTTTAFSEYTTLTAINSMFAVSVRNLMGIKYIFIGYIYALFIMIFLTGIYLAIKPKEKPATDQIDLS